MSGDKCLGCGSPQCTVERQYQHMKASFCDSTCLARFHLQFWTPLEMGRSQKKTRREKKSHRPRDERQRGAVPELALGEKQVRLLEHLKEQYTESRAEYREARKRDSAVLPFERMMHDGEQVLAMLEEQRAKLREADEWLRAEQERFEAMVNSDAAAQTNEPVQPTRKTLVIPKRNNNNMQVEPPAPRDPETEFNTTRGLKEWILFGPDGGTYEFMEGNTMTTTDLVRVAQTDRGDIYASRARPPLDPFERRDDNPWLPLVVRVTGAPIDKSLVHGRAIYVTPPRGAAVFDDVTRGYWLHALSSGATVEHATTAAGSDSSGNESEEPTDTEAQGFVLYTDGQYESFLHGDYPNRRDYALKHSNNDVDVMTDNGKITGPWNSVLTGRPFSYHGPPIAGDIWILPSRDRTTFTKDEIGAIRNAIEEDRALRMRKRGGISSSDDDDDGSISEDSVRTHYYKDFAKEQNEKKRRSSSSRSGSDSLSEDSDDEPRLEAFVLDPHGGWHRVTDAGEINMEHLEDVGWEDEVGASVYQPRLKYEEFPGVISKWNGFLREQGVDIDEGDEWDGTIYLMPLDEARRFMRSERQRLFDAITKYAAGLGPVKKGAVVSKSREQKTSRGGQSFFGPGSL
jgi:hypothetical protein